MKLFIHQQQEQLGEKSKKCNPKRVQQIIYK